LSGHWRAIRAILIAGVIGWAIGKDFSAPKVVTREMTTDEIELLLKAVGKKYGGVCL